MKQGILLSIWLLCTLAGTGTALKAQNWAPHNMGFGNTGKTAPFKTAIVDENTFWATPSGPAAGLFDKTPNLIAHTSDGGLTWEVDSLPSQTPNEFYVVTMDAVSKDSAWVVALENYNTFPAWDVVVMATFDGGDSWVLQSVELSDITIYPSQIHFFNALEGILFASSVDGYFQAFRTTDAGMNWIRLPEDNFPPLVIPNEFDIDHTYFAKGNSFWLGTTAGRFLHSTDKGVTWEAVETPVNGIILKVAFSDDLHGTAQYTTNYEWRSRKLIHTSDGGENWTVVNHSGLKNNIFDIKGIPEMAGHFLCTSFNNLNDIGLFFSEDNGMNWTPVEGITAPGIITLLDAEKGWISEISQFTEEVDVFKQEVVSGLFQVAGDAVEIGVSPNPATDFLYLQMPENITQPIEVSLFGPTGKLVGRQMSTTGQAIDLQGLAAGIYWVKAVVGEKVYTGKFGKF